MGDGLIPRRVACRIITLSSEFPFCDRHSSHELLYSGVSRGFKRPWKPTIDKLGPRKSVAFTVNISPPPPRARNIEVRTRVHACTFDTHLQLSVTSGVAHPPWPHDSIQPGVLRPIVFPYDRLPRTLTLRFTRVAATVNVTDVFNRVTISRATTSLLRVLIFM